MSVRRMVPNLRPTASTYFNKFLKRGIYGTWHQVSAKHLGRYVNEVSFRLNAGNVERHTLARLDSFILAVDGKRLTYGRLIG